MGFRAAVMLLVCVFLVLVSAACGGNGGEEAETETAQAVQGDAAAGEAVFQAQGCGSCHTFTAAGSTGTTGPNLDDALEGADAAQVEESIVDPNAEITEGFNAGVMPQDFGDKLSDEELADLVAFLTQQR
jgi:mono/diheme cytochrome c family protein